MIKMFITDAVVSKGYDNNPALRFFDGENGSVVSFRIGERVYDSRREDKHRWVNINVKAFGGICERIRKMKLKEGSFVNITGKYDEDSKEDKETGKTRKYPVVIIEDIEYCHSGSGQKNDQSSAQDVPSPDQPPAPMQQQGSQTPGQYGAPYGAPGPYGAPPQGQPGMPPPPMPRNFSGYAGLTAGENPYF